MDYELVIGVRSSIICRAVRDFAPDLIMVVGSPEICNVLTE
jgi:hypothetical protein